MKKSGSWEDVKSGFIEQLSAFSQGKIESSVVVDTLDTLQEQGYLSGDGGALDELRRLVSEADLPEDAHRLLLTKLVEQNTRIIPQHPASQTPPPIDTEAHSTDSKRHQTHSSSLLQDLLRWDAADQRKSIRPGQIIRGTYRLEFKIGSGGMGEVWKALDLIQDAGDSRDKYVAIKFISHEIRRHPDALKALVREFARYKKLIHPNIVKAYELNRDESEVFIVMEYLEGTSLKLFIKQHPGGIPLADARPIIKGMCDALEYAHHEGIIHLDFKPGNVFYDPKTHISKVIDFGIARLSSRQDRDKTRFDPGNLGAMTTAYASTEMLIQEDPDPRDDIYGLACVVYELLSGRHPFDKNLAVRAESAKMRPKPIPGLRNEELNAISHGLCFSRQDRTPSANQFFDELFLPGAVAVKKRMRHLIAGSLLTVASIAIPFIGYQLYEGWRFSQVKSAIELQRPEGLNDFAALAIDQQRALIGDHSLRLALLKLAAAQNQGVDLLQYIERLDSVIQQALLSDQTVRSYLIGYFIDLSQRAIADDDFPLAQQLINHILQQYPDSIQLMRHARSIEPLKKRRTETLLTEYQQCALDSSKRLPELFPCLIDHRKRLLTIDQNQVLPASATLSGRYRNEVLLAINENKPELAGRLIDQWRSLQPTDDTSRSALEAELRTLIAVNDLSEKLRSDDDRFLQQQITQLSGADSEIRRKALARAEVTQRIITFYSDAVSAELNDSDFSQALAWVADGIKLFADNGNEIGKLKALETSIKRQRADYIADLAARYDAELKQPEPNVAQILSIVKQASSAEAGHGLAAMPGLSERYATKIKANIESEQFIRAKRLLHDWKALKPADSETNTYRTLEENRLSRQASVQDRNKFADKLQHALAGGQLDTVNQIVRELKSTFSSADQEKIMSAYGDRLFAYYGEVVDTSIRQDAFPAAQRILADLSQMLPSDKRVSPLAKRLDEAKKSRIAQLLDQCQAAIGAQPLDGRSIFSPLTSLHAIDSSYIDQNKRLFLLLRKRLIKQMEDEKTIPQLMGVIDQWEKFINGVGAKADELREFFRKTKNLIALRCLFNGRKFKNTEQSSVANDYFMLGLSLEPIPTVREALEKELLR